MKTYSALAPLRRDLLPHLSYLYADATTASYFLDILPSGSRRSLSWLCVYEGNEIAESTTRYLARSVSAGGSDLHHLPLALATEDEVSGIEAFPATHSF